jgi:anti-anti-sigma factor
MAMKTMIRKDGNAVIVSIKGYVDYETTDLFKENLADLHTQAGNSTIIFDFAGLEFVGSSGISGFIHILKEFNAKAQQKPRYTNVKNEFKKMINAFDEQKTFEFLDSTEHTYKVFDN